MEKNPTAGSAYKNKIAFSLLYLLSYFLQALYGLADLFIIGRYEGDASTTAVSIGSQVMHILTVMTAGLVMGATAGIGGLWAAVFLEKVGIGLSREHLQ